MRRHVYKKFSAALLNATSFGMSPKIKHHWSDRQIKKATKKFWLEKGVSWGEYCARKKENDKEIEEFYLLKFLPDRKNKTPNHPGLGLCM